MTKVDAKGFDHAAHFVTKEISIKDPPKSASKTDLHCMCLLLLLVLKMMIQREQCKKFTPRSWTKIFQNYEMNTND